MTLALALGLLACSGDDEPTDTDTTTDGTTDTVDTDDTEIPTGETGTSFTVPDPVGDPATVELSGECGLADDHGGFYVEILYSDLLNYSSVSGTVADGVVPITILEEVGVEGGCRLMRRNNPFCDPPCGAGTTCDFDGSCIPYPDNQDLGTVTVGGMDVPVVMVHVPPSFNYFETELPHPVFQPGQLIELRTWDSLHGGDFTLHGVGVEPLDLGGVDTWIIYDGLDLPITWTPPTAPVVRSHVHLRLNIDQHGNTPVQMFCEFEDDGAASVPASLITQLVNFGVTGFPNATLTRRTVDSTTVEGGCVDFQIRSPVEPSVRVDGFIPCNGDFDCPEGQTCHPVDFICE
jgi:hypothetical protein